MIIACTVAGICAAGFVTIWFSTSYKELSSKRNTLADLTDQMHLYERLLSQAREGPYAQSAAGMLETSRMLCREASKSYNSILRKPMNILPAMLMGFRAEEEKGTDFNILEDQTKMNDVEKGVVV